MRLTADLARNALSYINPLGDRELDLRGHKIPAIENLGVAGAQDCIDFTDNDIVILGNIPLSERLHTLLLARNRIQHIVPGLSKAVPRLRTLVLSANNISELADLGPLADCHQLKHLVLTDNRVTTKENYRLYLIYLLPRLHTLDYAKIRNAERIAASDLFGSPDKPTDLANSIARVKSTAPAVNLNADVEMRDGPAAAAKRRKLVYTPAQREYFDKAIREAKTLQEVEKLQRDMAEGRLPKELMGA